jgi:two-component sensor histidine kinase
VGPTSHYRDGKVICVGHDITRRKKVEEQVRESLREKQVLLREIHHRVKNNLAVISSLLSFQSRFAGDEAHRQMFDDCQARIRSMALGHELVYQSENLANVKVAEYIEKLVDHLVSTTVTLGSSISVSKDIEQLSFGLDTITPLGFLLTELVSNCIKHAFPPGRKGEIWISLRSVGSSEYELCVRDNGVGMSNIETSNPHSLGQVLVDAFVQQLEGNLKIRHEGGTEVRIRFKEREKVEY